MTTALRMVLQRADSASLLVDNVSRRVTMPSKGILVFLAFFSDANDTHVAKAVKQLCETKIFSFPEIKEAVAAAAAASASASAAAAASSDAKPPAVPRAKPVAPLDDPIISVLVVPQASIAGKIKGKAVQNHGACQKDTAAMLYDLFIKQLRATLLPPEFAATLDANGDVVVVEKAKTTGGDDDDAAKAVAAAPAVPPRVVKNGTYGNLQSMTMDTVGPMTHVIDIEV